MVNYLYSSILLQEIPHEISLGFQITGCKIACTDCHSPFVWNPYYGNPLTKEVIDRHLIQAKHSSCILFLGGEDKPDLLELALECRRSYDQKLALYSGRDLSYFFSTDLTDPSPWISTLDYLKVGPYKKELGGLSDPRTNQRLYKIEESVYSVHEYELVDITNLFWKNI